MKAKRELEKEREAHEKELDAFTSRSREVMECYRECLHDVNADTEFPGECTMDEFMFGSKAKWTPWTAT